MAALTGPHIVNVGLDFHEKSLSFEVSHHCLARLVSVHSRVLAAVLLVDSGVVVHYVYYRKVMAKSHLIVVRVVSGSDLYHACTEIHFNVLVRDNGYLPVGERELHGLSDDALVAFVVRVNGDSSITEQRFRTRCSYLHEAASVGEGIVDVPEVTLLLLILALDIGDRGLAVRAPVYDALAVVDKTLLVVVDEYLLNSLGAAVVKCEALTLPVAGRAELFELVLYLAAVLVSPVPRAFEESVTSDVVLGNSLLLHLRNDLCLGRDGSMVGAGEPEGGITLHTLCAYQDILQGLVKRVTHVELSGNVRGRDNDSVGLFLRVALGVEVLLFLPVSVDALLEVFRGVGFCEFFLHVVCPFMVKYHTKTEISAVKSVNSMTRPS